MYANLLAALEASHLAQMARSAVWLYPISNLLHVLGAALLVGSIAVFDVLLFRRRYETAMVVAATALPLAALGILLQATSGSVLLSAEATAIGRNPVFILKMALVAIGLSNLAVYHIAWRMAGREATAPRSARVHAGVSLAVWISVLICGRMIAYV